MYPYIRHAFRPFLRQLSRPRKPLYPRRVRVVAGSVPILPSCGSQLFAHKMTTASQRKLSPHAEHEDFYRYTSGRWLWDEEQQLNDRYKPFDPVAL